MAEVESPVSLEFPRFYQMITSPDTERLDSFTSGDVQEITYYKNRADEYLLMCVHTPNEGIPLIWVRVERPRSGSDTIKFSYDRSKLWEPSDDDIMAGAFAALKFRHVIHLLNIVHNVTDTYRMTGRDLAWRTGMNQWDSMWYAGVVIGILHGDFKRSWLKPPPPSWVQIAPKLFGRKMKWATEAVERRYPIQYPTRKKVSLMESGAWQNDPTSLSQPPSSKQEGADSNPESTKEKIAHIGSTLTVPQEHPREPRPMQSANAKDAVPAAAARAKKNSGDQPHGREIRAPVPRTDPSNVLASNSLDFTAPHDPHRRSISPTRNPLSDQADERRPIQPASASSTSTPPTPMSAKEAYTGMEEVMPILQDVVSTAPGAEAFERGPQASLSSTTPQPSPLETPNLTGRILRMGSTPIATGGYSSVWRGSLLSPTSDESDRALQVAIKVLRASYTDEDTLTRKLHKRLHVEMRVWARLHHENVVRLIGYTEEPEGPGLVSTLYPRGNVLNFLVKNPSVNREVICADVALGLQYLHEQNPPIIHGDLKGPNVLIDAEGRASICDFGLSIILDGGPTGHTSSNFGGSLRFLAPELLDESTRTVETDIYGYACTCIEILFDQEPYHQLSKEAHLMRAIFSHQPPFEPSNEEVTFPPFLAILKCCWDHDRTSRPPLKLIIDTMQRCLFRTYRTNLSIREGIGERVRFMGLPGIEQANLISLADGGLSMVVNSSTTFHRVPIYQRYRWELMESQNLDDLDDDSDVSRSLGADEGPPFATFSPPSGKIAPSSESPYHVSKWRDYSAKFRLPYSSRVSYETYKDATLKMVLSMSR